MLNAAVQVRFEAVAWAQNYAGDFKISEFDLRAIDVESDLGYSSEINRSIALYVLHAQTLIPQLKILDSSIQAQQTTQVADDFTFGGAAFLFELGTNARSELHFDHRDVTLYYSIFAWSTNLSLGITARKFDGQMAIEGLDGFLKGIRREATFDQWVPLLYGVVNNRFEFIAISQQIELNVGSYQGNQMIDASIQYGWDIWTQLGMKLGLRYLNLNIDDFGGIKTDITILGPFIGLNYSLDI